MNKKLFKGPLLLRNRLENMIVSNYDCAPVEEAIKIRLNIFEKALIDSGAVAEIAAITERHQSGAPGGI